MKHLKYKPNMSEKIDWLYDYLLKFLQSPGWRSPILSFIDQHCSKFSPEEENKLIYSDIHSVTLTQKFKEMIDDLLEDLRVTLGVSLDQILKVCEIGRSTPADRKVFHQIFACDNFLSFKKLMVKRNQELESAKPQVQDTKKAREERKSRELTANEQGLAISLSREAFKGYLKQIKREKEEQKKKEWNVSCIYVGSKNAPTVSESGLIDLKIKVNKAIQNKNHKKGNSDHPEVQSSPQDRLSEVKSLQPRSRTSEFSSSAQIEETLEAKRLSLKEEEIRIHLERLQLEEEKKKILEEKKKIMETKSQPEPKDDPQDSEVLKKISILDFSEIEESPTPDKNSPETSERQRKASQSLLEPDGFKSVKQAELVQDLKTEAKIKAKTPNEKLLHLELMFQSYLSK